MKIKKVHILIIIVNIFLTMVTIRISPRFDVITFLMIFGVNLIMFIFLSLVEFKSQDEMKHRLEDIFHLIYSLDVDSANYEVEDDDFGKLRDEIVKVISENKIVAVRASENEETLREYTEDIAHQLKTPLTGILLMLDLIEGEDGNNQEYIQRIRSNTNRLHQLVEILLKLAALDSGTIKMKKDLVGIKDMVAEIIMEMEILFDKIKPPISILGDNFDLLCDREWTYEAIFNLVKNGIEASPEKGVNIILKKSNLYQSVIIEDYSPGMSDETLKEVYKRFHKANKNSKGYGIGLPMAKTIIEKQDGELIYRRGKTSNYFEFRFYR